MIKNELIKFFTPLKSLIYGGIIILFILINDVIFRDKVFEIQSFHDFLLNDMKSLVFVIPIILAPIVSEVFTYDYECGCMKFFVIYTNRKKVFFYKVVSLILITAIIVMFTLVVLSIVYLFINYKEHNIFCFFNKEAVKIILEFLVVLMPILIIYVMISILCKNSSILSVLIFLLVVMSDFIPKTIGDITPRRFLWNCFLKGQIDKVSITLFLVYILGFTLLSVKLFNKKEMIQ